MSPLERFDAEARRIALAVEPVSVEPDDDTAAALVVLRAGFGDVEVLGVITSATGNRWRHYLRGGLPT